MEKTILIGLLTALLTATTPLRAQIAPRDSGPQKGSRLELGRTTAGQKSTAQTSLTQRFSLVPASVNLDRSTALHKNKPINEYYRSLLVSRPASKSALKTSTPDNTPSVAGEARVGVEQERIEDRMYSSDRITVSNIYPNPASESAEVDYQFTGQVNEAKLILLNVLGSPVAEYELERSDRKVRIVTNNLATGYYFYQLSLDGKKVATKKLLVRHQ